MNLLFSVFFGAGAATFAYTKLGRRVGYGNTGNVWLITGIVFVIASIIFYTVLTNFIDVE
jgi:hypothetical protein